MFGIGAGELLLIGFLAIIFVRPEDLPELMRQIGYLYGKIMRAYHVFLDEMQEMEDTIKK
ncbi:hypothetical protein EBR96_02880 [bacterium]|nr:hypothetical protein [bacterium]